MAGAGAGGVSADAAWGVPVEVRLTPHAEVAPSHGCVLCLAAGRRTRRLADDPEALHLLSLLTTCQWYPDVNMRICWECKANILKISRFKSQVLTAQTLLKNQKHTECLSHLTIVVKKSHDREYTYGADPQTQDFNPDCIVPKVERDDDMIDSDVWADSVHYDDGTDDTKVYKTDFDDKDDDALLLMVSKKLKEAKKIKSERKKRKGVKKSKEKKERKCKKFQVKEDVKERSAKKDKREYEFWEICEEVTATTEQIQAARQNLRKNTGFAKSRHHCWSCILRFNNVEEFTRHCAERHFDDLGDIVCDICNCRFQTAELLEAHRGVHNTVVYKCKLCVYLSPTPKHLVEHYRKHDGKKYSQVKIDLELPGVEPLSLEKPTLGEPAKEEEETKLQIPKSKKGRIKCNICGVEYVATYFNHHYMAHISKERYECDYCGKVYNTRPLIFSHIKQHAERKKMCSVCGKLVLSNGRLKRHMLSHVGESERPYHCTQCPKKFTGKDKLDRHMTVHENLKPFQCAFCHRAFRVNSELTYHMKKIHDYGEIKKKTYETTTPLYTNNRKMKVDPKEEDGTDKTPKMRIMKARKIKEPKSPNSKTLVSKTYNPSERSQCTMCDKSFRTKVQLGSHMVVHTGQRPFSCDECGKTFKYHTGLWGHKLIHKGEKPHACNVCDAKFTLAGNLRAHMKIHTGEKPFMCDICGQKFMHRRNLRNHHKVHLKYAM